MMQYITEDQPIYLKVIVCTRVNHVATKRSDLGDSGPRSHH